MHEDICIDTQTHRHTCMHASCTRMHAHPHIYAHTHAHTGTAVCPSSLLVSSINWVEQVTFSLQQDCLFLLASGMAWFLLSLSVCYSSRGNSWQLYFRCGIVELIFSPDNAFSSDYCFSYLRLAVLCHIFDISLSTLLPRSHVSSLAQMQTVLSFGTN